MSQNPKVREMKRKLNRFTYKELEAVIKSLEHFLGCSHLFESKEHEVYKNALSKAKLRTH